MTATSNRGNEGTVRIESPDTGVSSSLTVMPGNFMDATQWAVTPCEHRDAEKASRFIIRHKGASPASHEDWQPILPIHDLMRGEKP